jgi:hypothetical protein
MVGIDAGAAVLALDNYLMGDRVRRGFHSLPCVARALEHLGFKPGQSDLPAPDEAGASGGGSHGRGTIPV